MLDVMSNIFENTFFSFTKDFNKSSLFSTAVVQLKNRKSTEISKDRSHLQ